MNPKPKLELTSEQAYAARMFLEDPGVTRGYASANCLFFDGVTYEYEDVKKALTEFDERHVVIPVAALKIIIREAMALRSAGWSCDFYAAIDTVQDCLGEE